MSIDNLYTRDPETKEVRRMEDMSEMLDVEDRKVANTVVRGKTISTVFLPMDHGFSEGGPPILWETMVFDDDHFYELQLRYSSEKEAEAGHAQVVTFLEGGGDPDEFKGL